MDIITAAELASWLRNPALAEDTSFQQVVDLTNEVLTDAWTKPESNPIPARVRLLALAVGARAWVNSPATSHVSSTSVSVDDGSTTERYRAPSRSGVYLTTDEVAALNGKPRRRSVRLVTYGQV